MTRRTGEEFSAELAGGAARFSAWRRGRELGARIPESLWALAVELAARHGVSRTARTLGVGYYALQERLATRPAKCAAEPPPVTFVEFPTTSFSAPCECSIEFEKSDGGKLRIQIRGPQLPDLATLGRAFWESP